MIIYKDEQFGFFELFNEENGTLFRSDINGEDPSMRSFPELIDVGIMGYCDSGEYCKKSGVDCYQMGKEVLSPHMSYDNFTEILKQATGKTFQIALGGAGDPNKHPQFKEFLKACREYKIVPNITTSGFLIAENEIQAIKNYCGAVAISWYSRLIDGKESNPETLNVINALISSGCNTNIHFVVSSDTINEAIFRLENDLIPKGTNTLVFLLYKPVGYGKEEKVLLNEDPRIKRFLYLATEVRHPYRIGFDTCFTPLLITNSNSISPIVIDQCEAATFSMYIDSRLNCYPCSFGIWDNNYSESMLSKNIKEIWFGEKFSKFRNKSKDRCKDCKKRVFCGGGCKLGLDINLC